VPADLPVAGFPNAWAGGWNAPQFSTVDIDADGVAELFVFDRSDERGQLFRWQGGMWKYLPLSDTLFRGFSAWVLLRDADGDGDKDLFTNRNSNLQVFRNVAPPSSPPRWQLWYDTVYSVYYGYRTPLYAASGDIPALTDVDADGDLDILVYEVLGALIEWHRNRAREDYGRSDTLVFVLQSGCWGHVFENYDYSTNTFTFQPYTCGPGQRLADQGPFRVNHAGGTLLVTDLNGDGLRDLIVGDDGPPYLIAGLNVGVPDSAHIDPAGAIAPYPPGAPVFLPSFPASYYEDVTGDRVPDLLVANNSPLAGQDTWNVWLYPNVGRADSPAWAPPVVGWLAQTQIDVGTAAHPTFADLNRDGHPDLIVSCESYFTAAGPKARAFLFWGSANGFTLADTNWLNLSSHTLRNPVFAAGDVNGNGRTDLLMGTSTGALWHWEESQPGLADFSLVTQTFAGLSGPPFAAPLLYDYDADGDLDLIVGGRNGRLSLYRQDAGGVFSLVTDFLGQIEARDTLSTLLGFARPALIDLDTNGVPELLVGNLTGFLRVYAAQWGAPTASWPVLADLPYAGGKRASPTVWPSPDTTFLLVGTQRGGVQAFTLSSGNPPASGISSLFLSAAPLVYRFLPPNRLYLEARERGEVLVYSASGQLVYCEPLEPGWPREVPLPTGLYVVSFHSSRKSLTFRVSLP